MQAFVEQNYQFVATLLASVGHHGYISSVHFAIGWKYDGHTHPELKDKHVLAVACDRHKQQWDFPGGRNENFSADPVVQVLETAYKELNEEIAVVITAPLESFVLEIIPCGRNKRNMLVVCGIKGLCATRFRDAMNYKQSIRPRLPSRFLEMTDFTYLCAEDVCLLAHSTSYVNRQHSRALDLIKNHSGVFPEFDSVMRIDVRW